MNGGSSWTDHPSAEESDGFTVAAGQTDTSLTVNVPDGSAITWRYKDSLTSSFSGATQSTLSASSTVDCTVEYYCLTITWFLFCRFKNIHIKYY